MIFTPAPLDGVVVVDVELKQDERGAFARTWCEDEMRAAGIHPAIAQCSISHNTLAGTLRGMHWQETPHAEAKLVRCTRGAIFDVCVDLRPDSPTRFRWFGVELTEDNRRALFIPTGFSHGFITLRDDTEVFYQISTHYVAESAAGHRFDDPVVGIEWPMAPRVISERDRTFPALRP